MLLAETIGLNIKNLAPNRHCIERGPAKIEPDYNRKSSDFSAMFIQPIQELQNRVETLEKEKQFLLKELRTAKNQRDTYLRELERKRLFRVS